MDTLISWGPFGLFLCAILDSGGVPNPGGLDALLLLVTAVNPRSVWLCATLSVIGSLIGCMFLYHLARKGGEIYLEKHLSSGRGAKFRAWFRRYGLLTLFIPGLVPFVPLPLKAFVICAGATGVRPQTFLLVLLVARVPRYFALAYLGAQLGKNSLPWLKTHAWHLVAIAAGLFVFLYALIRVYERMHARSAKGQIPPVA